MFTAEYVQSGPKKQASKFVIGLILSNLKYFLNTLLWTISNKLFITSNALLRNLVKYYFELLSSGVMYFRCCEIIGALCIECGTEVILSSVVMYCRCCEIIGALCIECGTEVILRISLYLTKLSCLLFCRPPGICY